MDKRHFEERVEYLKEELKKTRREYLETNRPIKEGRRVIVKGFDEKEYILTGYVLISDKLYYEVATITKAGAAHKSQRLHFLVYPDTNQWSVRTA